LSTKEFGGLGIINTQFFNEYLMTKWIWKLYKQKDSLWVRLLQTKYMRDGDFFKSNDSNGSQFWKCLHKVKHLFKWGAIHKVGNGANTQFWNDVWLTNVPLRIQFNRLYSICANTNITVTECADEEWQVRFRQMMCPEDHKEWSELQQLLQRCHLSTEEDEIIWGLTTSKTFATSSLYKFLTSGGINCHLAKHVWKCSTSLKIRIFLWQVFQNRILTAQQLKVRNWKGSEFCSLCGQSEDVDHLLFRCHLAEFVWAFVSEALGWRDYPRSMSDLISNWIPRRFGVGEQTGLTCFASLAWAIWNVRNKICIQHTFPNKSLDVVYYAVSFLQKWKLLMKATERSKVEALVKRMQEHARTFKPSNVDPSDVGFM
jgi:hypothetical protein